MTTPIAAFVAGTRRAAADLKASQASRAIDPPIFTALCADWPTIGPALTEAEAGLGDGVTTELPQPAQAVEMRPPLADPGPIPGDADPTAAISDTLAVPPELARWLAFGTLPPPH